ncbi:MAG: hypothetical protein L0H96_05170 [Humibacillus sp.]|nr:hypothetical protein [Humibacillus sp.]MDN5776279.1 hypothetical protein [Humibacillus sp.]
MPTEPAPLVEVAQAAVAAGDWITARTAFEALVSREPAAEMLAGLGDALWWLGETDKAVRYQQQAYAAFQHRGDAASSTMIAVGLYLTYRVSLGNVAAARGWLARPGRSTCHRVQPRPLGGVGGAAAGARQCRPGHGRAAGHRRARDRGPVR